MKAALKTAKDIGNIQAAATLHAVDYQALRLRYTGAASLDKPRNRALPASVEVSN